MAHVDRQEPDAPLDVAWATTVASQLGQLSLNPDADLSVSRVCVNVSLFLNIARQWEVDLVELDDKASTEAKDRIQELRATGGALLEDLEKLVQEVQEWKRPANDGSQAFKKKVKRTFDTPRVTTILAQLQYLEVTINLIIHVVKLGILLARILTIRHIRGSVSEEDNAEWLRGRLYIRSLLLSRQVALKYVHQRQAEEAIPIHRNRPLHEDHLNYLDGITYIGEDDQPATEKGYKFISDLVFRWTMCLEKKDDDDETQFEMDEEWMAGGPIPTASWSDDPEPRSASFDLPFRPAGLATMAVNSTRATPPNPSSIPRSPKDTSHGRDAVKAFMEGPSAPAGATQRADPLTRVKRPSITVDTSLRASIPGNTGRTPQSAQPSGRTPTTGPPSARPACSMRPSPMTADFGAYAPSPSTAQPAQNGQQHRRTSSSAGQGETYPRRSNRDSGFVSAENAPVSYTESSSDDDDDDDDDDLQVVEHPARPPSPEFEWRIAVGDRKFEFRNRNLVGVRPADVNSTLQRLYTHDNAVTEVAVSLVTSEALRRMGLVAEKIGATTYAPNLWKVTRALRYEEVRDLVMFSRPPQGQKAPTPQTTAPAGTAPRPIPAVQAPTAMRHYTSDPSVPAYGSFRQDPSRLGPVPRSPNLGALPESPRRSSQPGHSYHNSRVSGEMSRNNQPPPPQQQSRRPDQQPSQQQHQQSLPSLQRWTSAPYPGHGAPTGPQGGYQASPPNYPQGQGGYGYASFPQSQPQPSQNYGSRQGPPPTNQPTPSSRGKKSSHSGRKSRSKQYSDTDSSPERRPSRDTRTSADRDRDRRIRTLEKDSRRARAKEEEKGRSSSMRNSFAKTVAKISASAALLEGLEDAF